WKRDDIESLLHKTQRVLMRAAAADAHQRIQLLALVILHDDIRHVVNFTLNIHSMRFIATGAENCAADGEDSRERAFIEAHAQILSEAAEAVAETDDFHAVGTESRFPNATNGGVQSGTISACR